MICRLSSRVLGLGSTSTKHVQRTRVCLQDRLYLYIFYDSLEVNVLILRPRCPDGYIYTLLDISEEIYRVKQQIRAELYNIYIYIYPALRRLWFFLTILAARLAGFEGEYNIFALNPYRGVRRAWRSSPCWCMDPIYNLSVQVQMIKKRSGRATNPDTHLRALWSSVYAGINSEDAYDEARRAYTCLPVSDQDVITGLDNETRENLKTI